MTITFELNGIATTVQACADEKLLSVLRKLDLYSVKSGCEEGYCGFCTVLLNDSPVPSCKIPVGIVNNAKVETLEHFSLTKDYEDIMDGFNKAGMKMCGYCNSAKIFSVYRLLNKVYRPSKEQMIEVAEAVRCNCTERDTFINGIIYATANKHERDGRKKDV